MRVKEAFNKKLLVEGNDDQHVIWALCEKYKLLHNFDVIDCGGISSLLEQIPVRFKQANIQTIGIVVDADADLNNRWISLSKTLTKIGSDVPESLPENGLIIENESGQQVGVWIMPNNNLNGMLEDFISFLVPQGDKLLPRVIATLDNIEEAGLNQYALIHRSKAQIHSWLAWQQDPGTPMGLAITKSYLTTNHEVCLKLVGWFTELFKP